MQTVQVSSTTSSNDTVTLTLAAGVGCGRPGDHFGTGHQPSGDQHRRFVSQPRDRSHRVVEFGRHPQTSTNALVFGTLVSGVNVVSSPSIAGAAATYIVSFQATSPLSGTAGEQICLDETGGPTVFSSAKGALVTDTTAGWHFIASGLHVPGGEPSY